MGIDIALLQDLCSSTLDATDFPELGDRHTGKVRESYVKDGRRTLIVSDRVSCFDIVVGTIPLKGQVLNQIAAFWFEKTADIAPNHMLSTPDPSASITIECQPLPVEFVYRGYLTGSTKTSIWTAYERGDRSYCGHQLPEGLRRHEKLPEPLLTPTTKADMGAHDEVTSRSALIESGVISEEHYAKAEKITSALFEAGTRWAESCGLILVDTKYELGIDPDGQIRVIDEIHTPDSSRYWYLDRYAPAMSEGRSPDALDKEYVRLWLGEQGYKGEGTPPPLPDEVRCEAARRYIEAFEQISRRAFEPNTEEPEARLRKNLGL
jgi:phosphoribosylaminoimidazole-succinocarboxamide synthase